MADFKLKTVYTKGAPKKTLVKASETVIEAGDMVALDTGLAIKATAASTKIARTENGAPAWVTTVQVLNDPKAEFTGTADANFAVANRGAEVDLVVTGWVQLIDLWESTTNVFIVDVSDDAGVAWSTNNVTVRINEFLY